MKAADFYSELERFSDLLKAHGLKKKTRGTYLLPQNVKLQFILDKWGWDIETGWGFVVRIFDMKKVVDEYGNILAEDALDLKPHFLLERKLLDANQIKLHYSSLPPKLFTEFEDGWWYKFYDGNDLHQLLAIVMPPILKVVEDWRR